MVGFRQKNVGVHGFNSKLPFWTRFCALAMEADNASAAATNDTLFMRAPIPV